MTWDHELPPGMYFKLVGQIAVGCKTYSDFVEAACQDRTVRTTDTQLYTISTVFLGLNHARGMDGPPLIFETMVFHRHVDEDSPLDVGLGVQARYSTWTEAVDGHQSILEGVMKLERDSAQPMASLQSSRKTRI